MRQVAIFHEKIKDQSNGQVQIDAQNIQSFQLNQYPVTTGLLETRDTPFDKFDPACADKVLVRKKAFSCNYRDKALLLKAKHQIDYLADLGQLKFYTLGSEFVGEVVQVGPSVTEFSVGDQVIGNGNYPYSAYQGVQPGLPTNHGSKELEVFHFSKLVKVPKTMPIEVAASFPIGGQTAYSMVRKLALQPGERVLVTAATSNTSLFAISALKHLPVEVCALTTRTDFVDQLKDMGVAEVFVVERAAKSLAQDEKVMEYIRRNGSFHAVIDPFYDIYLGRVVDIMGLEGRYTTCGMYAQPNVGDQNELKNLSLDLMHIMNNVMIKNLRIIGNCIGKTSDLEKAIQDYMDDKLEVVIDSVYQNHLVSEFFERSFNSDDRFGKVVYVY